MMQLFDDLYSSFIRDEKIAENIRSPNPEDNLEIKMAIVGYSYAAATEAWGNEEYNYVKNMLSSSVGFSGRELLFYALGLGRLLGLAHSGQIDETEFQLSVAQLPGFILLKGGAF